MSASNFEKPAQIKRPYSHHLKIGAVIGVMATALSFCFTLSLMPGFPKIAPYLLAKVSKFLAIASPQTLNWLAWIDASYHTKWVSLGALAIGLIVTFLIAHLSYQSQQEPIVNRGGRIDSHGVAASLKKLGDKR